MSYLAVLVIKYICNKLQIRDLSERLYNYNSINVFLAAVFLFLYFRNLNIKNSKIINIVSKIAPLAFGVYIIHEQIVLRKVLYLQILGLDQLWNNAMQLVILPVVSFAIFFVCIIIERITKNTIQKSIYDFLEKIYLKLKQTKCYENIQYKILQKLQ